MRRIAAATIFLAMTGPFIPASAQGFAPRGPAESAPAANGRIDRLEQQMTDLQGVVAAVETLAKNNAGGGSGYAAAGGGASADQIRQLSEQIADLTQRLERLEARLGTSGAQSTPAAPPRPDLGYGAAPAAGFENKQQLPPLTPSQAPAPAYQSAPPQMASASRGYAAPAGAYGLPSPAAATPPLPAAPRSTETAMAGSGSGRALFDQAMSALNHREYSAAETYFQQYLDQYPSDAMAGSAQYWLGETAFVSGEYKVAADRFLKTFTTYPTNERAPDALLKLAISLHRLGQDTDACATFGELEKRYPQAKSALQRAVSEKRRARCS